MKVLALVQNILGSVNLKIRTHDYPEDCSVRFSYRGLTMNVMKYRDILDSLYVVSIDTSSDGSMIIIASFENIYND